MFKRLSYFRALAVFVMVTGASSLLTHLTLNGMRHSSAYASSTVSPAPKNLRLVSAQQHPQIVSAAFVSGFKTQSSYDRAAKSAKEDIDLGETFIGGDK
jgi:hypothetical protein